MGNGCTRIFESDGRDFENAEHNARSTGVRVDDGVKVVLMVETENEVSRK